MPRSPTLTPAERALLSKLGAMGGTKSSKRMTKAQRVERARKGGQALAEKRKAEKSK